MNKVVLSLFGEELERGGTACLLVEQYEYAIESVGHKTPYEKPTKKNCGISLQTKECSKDNINPPQRLPRPTACLEGKDDRKFAPSKSGGA